MTGSKFELFFLVSERWSRQRKNNFQVISFTTITRFTTNEGPGLISCKSCNSCIRGKRKRLSMWMTSFAFAENQCSVYVYYFDALACLGFRVVLFWLAFYASFQFPLEPLYLPLLRISNTSSIELPCLNSSIAFLRCREIATLTFAYLIHSLSPHSCLISMFQKYNFP